MVNHEIKLSVDTISMLKTVDQNAKCTHKSERQITHFFVFYNWSTKKTEPTVFSKPNRTWKIHSTHPESWATRKDFLFVVSWHEWRTCLPGALVSRHWLGCAEQSAQRQCHLAESQVRFSCATKLPFVNMSDIFAFSCSHFKLREFFLVFSYLKIFVWL